MKSEIEREGEGEKERDRESVREKGKESVTQRDIALGRHREIIERPKI